MDDRTDEGEDALWLGIICLVLWLLIGLPTMAQAEGWRLEALGGRCNQTLTGDGVWWNSAYPNNAETATTCFQIGVSRIETTYRSWDIGWRMAYVDFGTLRWKASYPLLDSEQHTVNPSGENCNRTTYQGCVGKGDHKQTTKGVSLGMIGEHNFGPFRLGGDVGMYVYRSRFSARIGIDQDGGAFEFDGLGISPYLGLTGRYGWLMVTGRYYNEIKAHQSGCGDCSGVTNGPATQFLAGFSIPF